MAQPVPPRVILVSNLRFEPLFLGIISNEWVEIQQRNKRKYTNILAQASWCLESYLLYCEQRESVDTLINTAVLMFTHPVK